MFGRLLTLLLALLAATAAQAQPYPSKPIRLIVTFAAGGGADFVGRTLAPRLGEALGQTVVVDNRAGANGAVGAEAAANAPPDGYTLLLGAAGTMAVAPHLGAKLPFDPQRDFIPVSLAATSPFVLVVHPSLPVDSVTGLIAHAQANPGKLNFGSSGNGGAPQLAMELFAAMAGIRMVHVPYRGLGPAVADLVAGQIQLMFADLPLVIGQAKAGSLRALAISSRTRSPVMPDLPPVGEAGLPGYEARTWYGVMLPARTPQEIVGRVHAATQAALNHPELRATLAGQGAEASPTTPEAFAGFLRAESDKWGDLIRKAGIKGD